MDKYEFKLKIDEMKALVSARNYNAAAEIAETISWRKIRNLNALVLAGEVFEQVGRFEESKEILLMAYDKSPIGRNIIYRLAEIAIKTQRFDEAQEYYDEFVDIAPHDNLKYVLKYKMTAAQGLPYKEQIKILEELKEQEYSEEWAYELAYLYHKDMQPEKCVEACDELILWFGDGIYVEKALELKMQYQPLSKPQEEKYRTFRQKRTGVIEVKPSDFLESGEIVHETVEIPLIKENTGQYTADLQEEIAKGMQQISPEKMRKTGIGQKMAGFAGLHRGKTGRQEQSFEQPLQNQQPQLQPQPELQSQQPESEKRVFEQPVYDTPPEPPRQMTFEEIQAEWERTKQAMQAALQQAAEKKLNQKAAGDEPPENRRLLREEPQEEKKPFQKEPLREQRIFQEGSLEEEKALQDERFEERRMFQKEPLEEPRTFEKEPLEEPRTFEKEPFEEPRTFEKEPFEEPRTFEKEPFKEQRVFQEERFEEEGMFQNRPLEQAEDVQAGSLEDAEQLMQQLLSIIPQLAEGIESQDLAEQGEETEGQQPVQLQNDLEQAGRIVAGMNQILQEQIDSLMEKDRQTQSPVVHRVSDPTREMPHLPEEILEGKENGAAEKIEMNGNSLEKDSYEVDNPVMSAYKEAVQPGISAIDLLQRVRMEKHTVQSMQQAQQQDEGIVQQTPQINAMPKIQTEESVAKTVPQMQVERPMMKSVPQMQADRSIMEAASQIQTERPMMEAASQMQVERPVAETAPQMQMERPAMEAAPQMRVERLAMDMTSQMQMERPVMESASQMQMERPVMESASQMQMERPVMESASQMQVERPVMESAPRMQVEKQVMESAPQMQTDNFIDQGRMVYSEAEHRTVTGAGSENLVENTGIESAYMSENINMQQEYASEGSQMYDRESGAREYSDNRQQVFSEISDSRQENVTGYPETDSEYPSEYMEERSEYAAEYQKASPEYAAGYQKASPEYAAAGSEYPMEDTDMEIRRGDPLKNKEMHAVPEYENEQENLFFAARPRFLTQAQLQAESVMDEKKDIQATRDFSKEAAKEARTADRTSGLYENGIRADDPDMNEMKRLTPEQAQVFSYFVPIAGMEAQIFDLLNGVSEHLQYDKHALSGNIIIEGISGSGKTVLIMDIIKVLQKEIRLPVGKTGKIDANALNQKDLDVLMEKISGGCLIIESAGKISRETAVKLSRCMESDHTGTLYIIEDTEEGIQKALARDSSFAAKFTEKISIPLFSLDELVAFGKAYANDLNYDIDEMGVLALYKRIGNIQKLDHVTTLTEVKEIVDEAIDNAEKGVLKKVFGILTATRANDDNYIILREKDFEE